MIVFCHLLMERIVELNGRYGDLVRHGWLVPVDNDDAAEAAATAIVDHIVT